MGVRSRARARVVFFGFFALFSDNVGASACTGCYMHSGISAQGHGECESGFVFQVIRVFLPFARDIGGCLRTFIVRRQTL